MRLESTFGKTEMEAAAASIIDQCSARGTWDVWFQVPNRDEEHHVGFTWLIGGGFLKPVAGMSMAWVVTGPFVAAVWGDPPASALGLLKEGHGLYLPAPPSSPAKMCTL